MKNFKNEKPRYSRKKILAFLRFVDANKSGQGKNSKFKILEVIFLESKISKAIIWKRGKKMKKSLKSHKDRKRF